MFYFCCLTNKVFHVNISYKLCLKPCLNLKVTDKQFSADMVMHVHLMLIILYALCKVTSIV